MTDLRRCFRCHKACGAASDDHDLLRILSLLHGILILAADTGVDQAGRTGSGQKACFTALEASDAVADVLELACFRLGREIRICQRSAAHADEVRFAHLQDGISHLGGVDAVRDDDRAGNQFFDHFRSIHVKGVLRVHRRDDLANDRRSIHSVGNMNCVNAQLIQMADKLKGISFGAAAQKVLIG